MSAGEVGSVEVATRDKAGELAERASDVVGTDDLLRLALQKAEGTPGIEIVERIVALREREQAQRAERAMAQALADFQAECPPIPRTKTAEVKKNGVRQYTYTFAPLDGVVRVIRPHLAKHGLSYTHDGEITDQGGVAMTCTLHHIAGAKRTATFRGPLDKSGGKNPIQEVASARSYGRRYSLLDVLGLTTEDDDDGHAAGAPNDDPISKGQVKELETLIGNTGSDRSKFLGILQVERLEEIQAGEFEIAKKLLLAKRRPS